jgi:hypothetical protein
MKTSEQINELAKAMALAQNQMRPASKDGLNPHFRSRYSNISSVWDSIREPLTANGLTVWQDVETIDKSVSVTTRVIHNSGQWVEFGPLIIPLVKFDPQAIGSATSYAKRYALCAAIGVVSDDEDDDGEKAQARNYKAPIEPKIEEPDLTHAEVMEFVNSVCPEVPDKLKTYIDEIVQKSNWDYRKTVDTFKKQKESCAKKFEIWLGEQK